MRNVKRFSTLILAVLMALSLTAPALGAMEDTGYSDVDADAWYAEAVQYCRDHDLMNGVSADTFQPEGELTRAQLATVLYRIEGEPAVTGTDSFTDTAEGSWYSAAVLWASWKGLVNGYGNGLFGPNDPVSREQMTVILWRYAGSPAASAAALSDKASVSTYAAGAVDWASSNAIVIPLSGSTFGPKDNATRAQVAAALMAYDLYRQSASQPGPAQPETGTEPAPGPEPETSTPQTLSSTPLYEDSNVKITFVRLEKSRYDDDEAELYLDVDNKTMQPITIQCDAVSLDGYCFNHLVMSDDVSANSIGTVNTTIEDFGFTPVDLSKVQTVGGQFTVILGGMSGSSYDSYKAIFPARNVYTGQTDSTIPSAGGRTAIYSDSSVEFYFDHAEAGYSSDELEVYLLVRNKTAKTLLIQNDTVTVDRRSYGRTIMSDPVLAYSTGIVNVSVQEYSGPSAPSVTTVGGDFRIIDDNGGGSTYVATMGNVSSVGSDGGSGSAPVESGNAPSGGDSSGAVSATPTGGTTKQLGDGGPGTMLLNVTAGTIDPSAVYPGIADDVPDFGGVYGLVPDPNFSEVREPGRDYSYCYYFYVGPGGFSESDIVMMRNDYCRKLAGGGFSNWLGTDVTSQGDGAFDQFVKKTESGTLYVHVNFAVSNELDFGYLIVSVTYK